MPNTTTLDYAILGLLKNDGLSGYAVRKIFENSALGNYSSSPGTIYPALNRLVKQKFIQKFEAKNNKKAVFEITKSGIKVFKNWLQITVSQEDVNKRMHIVLLKFAFFDAPENLPLAINFLKDLIILLTRIIGEMNQFKKEQTEQLSIFGRLAFENGLDGFKAHLKWTKRSLKELGDEEKNNLAISDTLFIASSLELKI